MTADRRSPRKAPDRILPIQIEPDIPAIVLNTSDEGLGFRALSPLPELGAIRVFFTDNGRRIDASGEIVWLDSTKKNGGLRLAPLPQGNRERILDWATRVRPPAPIEGAATTAQPPKEFPLPSPSPASPAAAPAAPYVPPPPPPYVPPPGLPVLQPLNPGYVMFEDDPEYLQKSRTRFFPGVVTGVIITAIAVAILFFAFGGQTGALLTRWRAAISPSPSAPAASTAPVASNVPNATIPPAPEATPPPSGPAPPSVDAAASPAAPDSAPPATSAATQPPTAKDAASDAGSAPVPVADPGEDDLASARRYLNAKSGRADTTTAARFLWSAVKKGNLTAEVTLADLYARGDGVSKSCDQARVLLQAAAEKGSSQASERLGQILRSGCR